MTRLDHAFIKAYARAAIPAPHWALQPAQPADDKAEACQSPPAEAVADASPAAPLASARQVDRFQWPNVCNRLITTAASELERIAEYLSGLIAGGAVTLAFTACGRGQGAKSVLLCAARSLAASGLKTIAVDADFHRPQLGHLLGLVGESGWDEVLAGRQRLDDAIVQSTEDRLSVLPVRAPVSISSPIAEQAAETLDVLRARWQAVLVNLGPLENHAALGLLRAGVWHIDAALLVSDVRPGSQKHRHQACRRLKELGIEQVSIVENFLVEQSAPLTPSAQPTPLIPNPQSLVPSP